jgi:acetyl-CoA carboxylase carboxyltransferase component
MRAFVKSFIASELAAAAKGRAKERKLREAAEAAAGAAGAAGKRGAAAEFDRRVAIAYDNAKAVNAGMGGGLDDVIDPATTRDWIASGLRRLPPVAPRTEKKYPFVDTW